MSWVPRRRMIGVLGGMGPMATIDFMAKIAAATPAGLDQEHVPLIVHNVPQIPDRSTAILQGSDAPFLPMLAGMRLLESSGVDLVAIPCNTAHFWYDRLARSCGVEILHIADAVSAVIAASPWRVGSVVLLATRGTIQAEIYQSRLRHLADVIVPDERTQQEVDEIIAGVKGGAIPDTQMRAAGLSARLLADAQDALLLLACTELPVAFAAAPRQDRFIDATKALAAQCVTASLGAGNGSQPTRKAGGR